MYSVLNRLSEFYISKNITSYTFLLVFKIVESLQCILNLTKIKAIEQYLFKVNNKNFRAVPMDIAVGFEEVFVNWKGICKYSQNIFPGLSFMAKINISLDQYQQILF